jgi:hypothetical protein
MLVELWLGLRHHPRPRDRAPWQELPVGLRVAAIAALDLLDQFPIDIGISHLNRVLVPRAEVPDPEISFSYDKRRAGGVIISRPAAMFTVSAARSR